MLIEYAVMEGRKDAGKRLHVREPRLRHSSAKPIVAAASSYINSPTSFTAELEDKCGLEVLLVDGA